MAKFNEFIVVTHTENGEPTVLELLTPETKASLKKRIKFGREPECHGETTVFTRAEFNKMRTQNYKKNGDV